jgi:hypothetical protein
MTPQEHAGGRPRAEDRIPSRHELRQDPARVRHPAVSIDVKDADDPNPLVHALAIRTMGCLCAEKLIDCLYNPLQKCLHDENLNRM